MVTPLSLNFLVISSTWWREVAWKAKWLRPLVPDDRECQDTLFPLVQKQCTYHPISNSSRFPTPVMAHNSSSKNQPQKSTVLFKFETFSSIWWINPFDNSLPLLIIAFRELALLVNLVLLFLSLGLLLVSFRLSSWVWGIYSWILAFYSWVYAFYSWILLFYSWVSAFYL